MIERGHWSRVDDKGTSIPRFEFVNAAEDLSEVVSGCVTEKPRLRFQQMLKVAPLRKHPANPS
ncbi:hypothetical protein [Ralstonia pseudosolanacearum]|uniref:hypothetical protein n=1 Tax=Ralstonia pseudosolanacearum TaxID=1310165 RepID=UPI001FFDCF7C|nr:hypothetical protein [Ralstonia pseudosolanacearum]